MNTSNVNLHQLCPFVGHSVVLLGTKIQQFLSNFQTFIGTHRFVRIFPIHISLFIQVSLSTFISSQYHFLNHPLCGWMNYYLLSIQPQDTPLVTSFLLRHCLTLPCLFHFQPLQPLCLFTTAGPCPRSPSLFVSPQVSLKHFLKLWSPMPSGYATQMAGSSANTKEKSIGFNCLLVQKVKIISHRDGKNLTPFTSWSWMSLSPLNLNTWYLFPQKSQARWFLPSEIEGKGAGHSC